MMMSMEAEVRRKRDEKMLEKIKQEYKEIKAKQASQQTTVLENHVTQKNFASNFEGMRDMFVHIFGS